MDSERRRRRGWLLTGVALLVVAWSFIALLLVQMHTWRDHLRHRAAELGGMGWPGPSPVHLVASESAFILGEAAVLWVILTQLKKPLWIRAGAASLVMLVVVAVSLKREGDCLPHVRGHLDWALCMSSMLAVLCLVLGIARITRHAWIERSG
jgi:hypothetical protein